ncbi:glycoside hydrolase family 27 protein [Luteibacter sp. UNCMF366Tsu5.1]|uniref:glycoside hydrolase family 27 protein n=1 Tax=Luteibacter sp. UNCMF366Tsu5.1 TaxID=1502758 RepID=UPI0009087776|nr:glycoside hydrolase family 27 protein [Luteibacter sp. UNCMF366Tsu5.1]SFW25245.1 alpha-galactosidase [Luteibacter sp. UNCMF366Tsu5.1]
MTLRLLPALLCGLFALMPLVATAVDAPHAASPAPVPAVPGNGLALRPPMGWNSWNHFAGRITAKDVRAMADAMVSSGMRDAGYVYVNIDDTWEGTRTAAGEIRANDKFGDMKALADYVHARGLKLGIYSSPGATTCAGFLGSHGHEDSDARTFATWGVDFLKYDYCGARDLYPVTLENQQALFRRMGAALRKTGRPMVYSLSQSGDFDIWRWGPGTGANMWRTTPDISDDWTSMSQRGFRQLDLTVWSGPGHWNDPDMLEIGNGGMTPDEYRTQMSLWSLLPAPLLAGNDLTSMDAATRDILLNREVIAVDQDPAGKPARRIEKQGDVEVLVRDMSDGSVVVGLFNRGDRPAPVSIPWQRVHARFGSGAHVRDLWAHTSRTETSPFHAVIARHGVILLRLTPMAAARILPSRHA